MLTAYPNRTSPVLRGAWILDRLLGTPPADPPLDVPSLPENRRGQPARTLRARLEQHREKPTCFACHGVMDPLGLRARELQRGGAVPRQRPRHADADRHRRSAAGRHADQRTRRSAPGAGRSARSSVRAGAHREPDDLRAGPQPRLSRHAHGAPHRAAGGGRTTTGSSRSCSASSRAMRSASGRPTAARRRLRSLAVNSSARTEDCSHVPDSKASVAAHRAEGRRRDHRAAVAGRDDSGRHGAGADGRGAEPAPRLRLLPARRAAGRMAADARPAATSTFRSSSSRSSRCAST